MSRLVVLRPARLIETSDGDRPPSFSVPKKLSIKSRHVSLISPLNVDGLELERLAQIVKNAPESTKDTINVDVDRAGRVGQKLASASLALMLAENPTLREEVDYYSEEFGAKPITHPHITIARGVPLDQLDQCQSILEHQVRPDLTATLAPVRIIIR